MSARALMVQGTSSWAGKSLLTTVLCRHFARRGLRVAPFKAQNMSNNARVVDGGEIGVAQYLQALAARARPDVRMNPVLVKPEAEMRSQVVVRGVADATLSALPWPDRAPRLRPMVDEALDALLGEFDLVVLEGAGSPAEINLAAIDLTNLEAARRADAAVLLACDIDRGGAFAHLYGTWALLDERDRARVRGFILNKFRGDPALLEPGPEMLEARTGVPTLGVVPMIAHGLPDEDGAALSTAGPGGPLTVAIVRYPTASNLDEFKALEAAAAVRWAGAPADLDGAGLVILPGSKHVAADLAWLRAQGLDRAIAARAAAGRPVLGICGGTQMLGRRLDDPAGVDGAADGLGLLPLTTTFAAGKLVERTRLTFGGLPAPFAALNGVEVDAYEIRHGRVTGERRVWSAGAVLGITFHGLFEAPAARAALTGRDAHRDLDTIIDDLTDRVTAALDLPRIEALVA